MVLGRLCALTSDIAPLVVLFVISVCFICVGSRLDGYRYGEEGYFSSPHPGEHPREQSGSRRKARLCRREGNHFLH